MALQPQTTNDPSAITRPDGPVEPRPPKKAQKRKRVSAESTEASGSEVRAKSAKKTRSKGKAAAKAKNESAAKSAEMISAEDKGEDEDAEASEAQSGAAAELTKSGKVRKRKAPPGPTLAKTAIPKQYEECTAADKTLIDWRDAGEDWPKIKQQYEVLGGKKTECKSYLPNRYQRMKSYFARMNDEDIYYLFQAKFEEDAWWETEQWERIAKKLEQKTGNKYTVDMVRRNYRRHMESGTLAVAEAKKSVKAGADDGQSDGEDEGEAQGE